MVILICDDETNKDRICSSQLGNSGNLSKRFTNVSVLDQIRARVAKTLTDGIQLDMSTDESKKFLKRHTNRKTNVVIMFIEINNSTQMSPTTTWGQVLL